MCWGPTWIALPHRVDHDHILFRGRGLFLLPCVACKFGGLRTAVGQGQWLYLSNAQLGDLWEEFALGQWRASGVIPGGVGRRSLALYLLACVNDTKQAFDHQSREPI